MKTWMAVVVSILVLSGCGGKFYNEPKKALTSPPTLSLTLVPQEPLVLGKPVPVLAKLMHAQDKVVVFDSELQKTPRLHLVDARFSDYQVIMPQPTTIQGLYQFNFTPRSAAAYRAWAEATPKAGGRQEFPYADIGRRAAEPLPGEQHEVTIDGMKIALSIPTPLMEGKKGEIMVSGIDAAALAGIYDDFRTFILAERTQGQVFTLTPVKAGLISIVAPVRSKGKERAVRLVVSVAHAK